MLRQAAWAASEPGTEDVLLGLEAETEPYGGRVTEGARTFYSRGNGGKECWGNAFAALRESLLGNRLEARHPVADALRLSSGREVKAVAALALAFAGEFLQSQKLLTALTKEFPEDTIVRFKYGPTISAQLALGAGDARRAIATSGVTVPYELGDPTEGMLTAAMYPVIKRPLSFRRSSSRLQHARRHRQSQGGLSGFPHAVEERGP